MPIMIIARPHTIIAPLNHVNHGGWNSASPLHVSTHTGNRIGEEVEDSRHDVARRGLDEG